MPFLILERGRVRKWRPFIGVDFFPNLQHHFFYIIFIFSILWLHIDKTMFAFTSYVEWYKDMGLKAHLLNGVSVMFNSTFG